MTEPYEPRFPELLDLWRSHDLAFHEDLGSIRPWFYEGLRPEGELRVWEFIEENYLLKYRDRHHRRHARRTAGPRVHQGSDAMRRDRVSTIAPTMFVERLHL